jgi:hypothetical protein
MGRSERLVVLAYFLAVILAYVAMGLLALAVARLMT